MSDDIQSTPAGETLPVQDLSPLKDRKPTKDEIALMARELVLVTLPHKDPGNVPRCKRQNGKSMLAIQPGYQDDPKDKRKSVSHRLPLWQHSAAYPVLDRDRGAAHGTATARARKIPCRLHAKARA